MNKAKEAKRHTLVAVYTQTHRRVVQLAKIKQTTICLYMRGLIDREWRKHKRRMQRGKVRE